MREARRKGVKVGRPKGAKADMKQLIKTNAKYKTAAKALKDGTSLRKTAAFAGISVNTVRKIKKAIGLNI